MALGGMLAVQGSKFIGYPSAGALGCIAIAFVAGIGWRRRAARVGARDERPASDAAYVSSAKFAWRLSVRACKSSIDRGGFFIIIDWCTRASCQS